MKQTLIEKYVDIIKSGHIEENQITSLRSWLNNSATPEERNEIWEVWEDELLLSISQNQKGIQFLLNEWKTPRGQERKNNPFGYREQEILKNVNDITLKSLYDAGNMYVKNYLPLYSCNDKDGNSFEYYYNGKINIVG